jgi:hypothetical protein
MNEFTLLNFSEHTKNETPKHQTPKATEQMEKMKELEAPDRAVQHVLNYSKSLSVRPSNHVGHIENVLN